MCNLRRVLLERCKTVWIADGVERKAHFVVRGFLLWPRSGHRSCASKLLGRLSRGGKFLPQQGTRRQLVSRIALLQRFQLAFQLPQGKRHIHFRRDKKRLNEHDRAQEKEYPRDEQGQAKARPALPRRIGENERCNFFWREL